MQMNVKCIDSVLAFGKYFARILGDDTFSDGKTETVAVIHFSGFVASVKALEDVFQFIFGYGFAFVTY